ncbi:MAG TPA: CoB--CoM heterodisulfide reductase subunit C [Methanothermococcus okinawensis]|uniref:CoB--CoM heterodisulfide reductase subunit C n=1 Tax=Methanothermococcus okinawensis TaxID=155863 RepID=A0A832YT76_9EURY|nr:CoB--CoM heterodisulfide reductase subunit C [Methanothermococcus okinawensis]
MVVLSKSFNEDIPKMVVESGKDILGKEHIDSFQRCYQCGTCTGTCPSGRITAFKTRKLMKKILCGMDIFHEEDMWMCTTCYECYEKCPRNVKITDIIKAARNVACKMGAIAEPHRKTALYVFLTGHAVPVNDEIKKVRKNIGLTEIPPTTHKYPEVLEEIRGIMADLDLCNKVGICPTTKVLKEIKPVKWKDMSE